VCATIHQPSSAVFEMFDDLLLLRKGGEVVYFGPLGAENCSTLVNYFESLGAEPIALGDNPANWMLRVVAAEPNLAEKYLESNGLVALKKRLEELHTDPDSNLKIEYTGVFAATFLRRRTLVNKRLATIYWRSPAYNLTRVVVSLVIAFILGSSFVNDRHPAEGFTESQTQARVAVIFLSFIIPGILGILSVLPVMTAIRDMFQRHRNAGMHGAITLNLGLAAAELWFILISSALFCTVFVATAGFADSAESRVRRAGRYIGYFGFYTFNYAIYVSRIMHFWSVCDECSCSYTPHLFQSFMGALFVCLVRPLATAVILSSVYIGLNNFFAGLVVRPQYMIGTFYVIPFYICPGHYVYDGMVFSLYHNNNQPVVAAYGSDFNDYLIAQGNCSETDTVCIGTVHEYVQDFFGGKYARGRKGMEANAIVLGMILLFVRFCTLVALRNRKFT
jgi:hypothetical protein